MNIIPLTNEELGSNVAFACSERRARASQTHTLLTHNPQNCVRRCNRYRILD
jgi:hypothetical protein